MTPYSDLEQRAFWKPAVAERGGGDIADLWVPKFAIKPGQPIATMGSCFAQNIGRALRARGLDWLETEHPPADLPRSQHAAHGYGLFTCRTGNIYTAPLLAQWVAWALGDDHPGDAVWRGAGGRFFDPFRPSVSPTGFDTPEALFASRDATITAFRAALGTAQHLIFTPGLIEAWRDNKTGAIFPACPGTVQGTFDKDRHRFEVLGFEDNRSALTSAIAGMRRINPGLKILLTVSPVPITATQTGRHVLDANGLTKSTLRTVIGEVARDDENTDYFPSYELATGSMLGLPFYGANARTAHEDGLDMIMRHFFAAHDIEGASAGIGESVCEDELLDFYAAP